ncbi:MAG: thiamine phosphate synthase [Candidatus Omnitrophota bacterium]|nr:thiamine phosphate synthase [Candidatus Omnitrophota bacterium]
MGSKKRLLKGSSLYVILDRDLLSVKRLLATAEMSAKAGADIFQLRDKKSSSQDMIKTARALKKIADKYGIPLIINDRPEVACAIDSDGIHIGQGDFGVTTVKRLAGKDSFVGVSVNDIKKAGKAISEGADYLGAGPVFMTPIKSRRKAFGFNNLSKMIKYRIPVFAIGGIKNSNIRKLSEKGFKKVAVIRAVCQSHDPFRSVKELKGSLV